MNSGKGYFEGHGCTADNNGPAGKQQWRLAEAQQVIPSSFWDMV